MRRRPAAPPSWSSLVSVLALTLIVSLAPGSLALAAHPPASPALPPDADAAASRITAAHLAADLDFLADDALEGRGPGSRGDLLTRRYLASQLARLGLEPGAADGSWEQKIPVVGITSRPPATWTFRGGGASLQLGWWDDFIAVSGVQLPRAEIHDAELIFVGYGIVAPELGWDDFKGVDLRGKVLLMLNNDPDWDPNLFAGKKRLYYGRWTYKYESAARQGAAGAIILHTTPSAGYPWQVVQTSWGGEQFELPAGTEHRLQVAAWTTEEASRRLAKLGGRDLDELVAAAHRRDFRPVPLGVTTSLAIDVTLHQLETGNVLGLLRGGDPQLAAEVVVFTAHHDHFGIGVADARGDTIYNGAVDNASGVAQVLAIAEAATALRERPQRSLLFLLVAGEERGLLGSRWYAQHPTFPPGKIAADVNFDSANLYGRTRDVTYIGYGKSSLDGVIERVAALQGRRVADDPMPDRGFFYRSDQFSFAQIGVPGLYVKGGSDYLGHEPGYGKQLQQDFEAHRYHQPSDQVQADWDYSGIVEDTRLGFLCGLAIANDPALPSWKPGDEFAAARAAALAAGGY